MQLEVENLKEKIKEARVQLLLHPVYAQINNLDGLKNFTQFHVFAVWDFMSLLKSLQIGLTRVALPWVPVGSANTRYLINEIVLGEESDVDEHDNRISHFELYLKAMRQMGTPTNLIDALINEINNGHSIEQAIQLAPLPDKVKKFLLYTFEIAQHAPLHVKAAVFTFGREDLIPDMFIEIVNELSNKNEVQASQLVYYLNRHIEVDGGEHGPMSLQMIEELCGNDTKKWEEAVTYSRTAMAMRIQLWDGILRSLN